MKKSRIAVVIATFALLGAFAIQASAHKQTITANTNVVETPDPAAEGFGAYSGKITSKNAKCVAGRKVSVIVSQSGTLTTTVSDSAGNWKTARVKLAGDLVGVAPKTIKKNKKHKHTCKGFSKDSTAPGGFNG